MDYIEQFAIIDGLNIKESQQSFEKTFCLEEAHSNVTRCPSNTDIQWNTLLNLPYELSLHIFRYLDIESLCSCSVVCKSWCRLARDPFLYKWLLASSSWADLPSSYSACNSKCFKCWNQKGQQTNKYKDINWYEEYKRQYQIRKNWLKGRYKQRIFTGHTSVVNCVVFNEEQIISGSADTTIRVWNLHTNAHWSVQTLVGHSQAVRCLQLLHCPLQKKKQAPQFERNESCQRKNKFTITPRHDVLLVSGSNDQSIKIWALAARDDWSSIVCKATLIGHTGFVRCLQADHEKIVSGSYDYTLKIWCISTASLLATLRGHEESILCLQYDDNIIVSGSLDKTIRIWLFSGECIGTLSDHSDPVACLHLNYAYNRIISGSHDHTLKFWDISTQRCVRTIDWKESEGHHRVVRCLQADWYRFISGSDDKTIKVWSIEDGTLFRTYHGHKDGVSCLQFNNEMLVSGSYDHSVILWDFSVC